MTPKSITPSLCFLFLLLLFTVASAVPSFLNYSCVTANDQASTTYLNNLNILLTNLTSDTQIDYGFYTSSFGENSDTAYAIGMCRGDVKLNDCRSCLNDSRLLLTQICPNHQAVGWYEYCMLRYSNRSILRTVENYPQFPMWNPYFVSSKEFNQFNKSLKTLMDKMRIEASGGDYRRKYAFENVTSGIQSFKYIFGLAQCTPDLSRQQCDDCLSGAFSEIPSCCNGRRGARVIKPSCNIRYEIYPFLTSTIDALSPLNTPGKDSNTTRTIVTIVAVVAAVTLALSSMYVYLRLRMSRKNFRNEESDEEIIADESLQFTFDTIRVATEDFSYSNKLGEGGFGAVYKGTLSNGQMIAVKRLSKDSDQGDIEFRNEVQLLADLQHENLVKLLGFCLKGSERLLIYEFVPNKSLDYFLFDPSKPGQLDWIKRFKIIEGIARALLYLHEDCRTRIIHRDLKPSNILLDEEMNAKLSDFGLARLFIVDQNQGKTSKIVGTYGYMAPEYAMYGQFSVKSDVFSFGVLVLEIVSGEKQNCTRRCGDTLEELPLSFAWRNWMEGRGASIIDPSLSNSNAENEILRCIHIGLLCVQENLVERPTMASIVLMLNSPSLSLPVPTEPAFFAGGRAKTPRGGGEKQSEEYILKGTNESTGISVQEFTITKLYAR